MKRVHLHSFLVLLFLCLLSARCGDARRKGSTWQGKYEAATNHYLNGRYARASLLFEELLPLLRGTKRREMSMFMYADALYQQKEYILATEYFKIFTETYPRHQKVEQAAYMQVLSQYQNTEDYSLDPTPTYATLEIGQNFLNRYPKSTHRAEIQEMIDNLQDRLAEKSFQNARQYYSMGYHKAAFYAFQNFQRSFPLSKHVEESAYLCVDSQYRWALGSIASKRIERYENMRDSYEDFIRKYPKSAYIERLSPLYKMCLLFLETKKKIS